MPSHHRTYEFGHQPMHSSPLASPAAPASSPLASASLRRRSQYKTHTGSTQTRRVHPGSCPPMSSAALFENVGRRTTADASKSQGSILREKFKARCFERAAKAKERVIASRRFGGSEASSDGPDEAMDDETGDAYEDMMQDELFRRIMENSTRKSRHSYRLSYEHEVGSSFDPDMEDVDRWEEIMGTRESTDGPMPPVSQSSTNLEEIFEELEEEELIAYAEECAKRAALADFEDITAEELSNWSDFEDELPLARDSDGDTDMN
ncbi:hypothetical protein BD779DRAFT_1576005 [Infundibulicybe gibba]|nr:hypothetical protein BD779DRAFT_1576005 [Infundibulicybe gibba]